MNEDQNLHIFFKEIFEYMMDTQPILATWFGYKHERYDHLLPDGSLEENEKQICQFFQFKEELRSKIDYNSLTHEGKLDYDLLLHFINLQLFSINELATWRSGTSGGSGPIGTVATGIYLLYTRDFAPIETRVKAIISRLKATAQFLEETKSTWQFPVRLWTEMALEEGPRTIGFMELVQTTLKPYLSANLHQELVNTIKIASETINYYVTWIKEEIVPRANHEWPIGSQKFIRLIELRKLGKTPQEILSIGEELLEKTKLKLEKLVKELYPNKSVEEVREIIKSDHPPTFEMILEHVSELTIESREFIKKNNLMTIPKSEELKVIPTPSFLIPIIPFAAYMDGEKFSKTQIGQYIVTPIESDSKMLSEHNYASCRNTAVHEGYPGHHLQISCANLQPNLIRSIISGDETVEGWAHYCEQLMAEKGFLGKKEVFMQLIDQLWRAVRIIVDVKLHTEQMTFDEAKQLMIQEIGMVETAVIAELKRYTATPGYQLSYLLGKLMLLELRDEIMKKMGKDYSDQFFHNTILNNGGLPIFFLRRLFDLKINKKLHI